MDLEMNARCEKYKDISSTIRLFVGVPVLQCLSTQFYSKIFVFRSVEIGDLRGEL